MLTAAEDWANQDWGEHNLCKYCKLPVESDYRKLFPNHTKVPQRLSWHDWGFAYSIYVYAARFIKNEKLMPHLKDCIKAEIPAIIQILKEGVKPLINGIFTGLAEKLKDNEMFGELKKELAEHVKEMPWYKRYATNGVRRIIPDGVLKRVAGWYLPKAAVLDDIDHYIRYLELVGKGVLIQDLTTWKFHPDTCGFYDPSKLSCSCTSDDPKKEPPTGGGGSATVSASVPTPAGDEIDAGDKTKSSPNQPPSSGPADQSNRES